MKIERGLMVCNDEEYKALRSMLGEVGVNARTVMRSNGTYWIQFLNPYKDECFLVGDEAMKNAKERFEKNLF